MRKLVNTLNLMMGVALLCMGDARARAESHPVPPAVDLLAQAGTAAGGNLPSNPGKGAVQHANDRAPAAAPQRGANQPIRVVVSSQSSDGVTQQNFDLKFLRNLEAYTVERVMALAKEYFASLGNPNADVRLTSEATYVQSGPVKLAVIRLRAADGSNQVLIAGIVGNEFRRVVCVRDSPERIPVSYGVCADKIKEVFDVKIGG